jgi:uncharacterized protein YdhG (YjbR/CyaY superfamily)
MNAVDAYIAGFPAEVQERMQALRKTIRKVIPDAEESITYQIPTFKLNGKAVVYFAGFIKHIGFYPVPVGNPEFGDELAAYASGKGTAKFPMNQPIPLNLVEKIVKFRVKENQAADARAAKRKKK